MFTYIDLYLIILFIHSILSLFILLLYPDDDNAKWSR